MKRLNRLVDIEKDSRPISLIHQVLQHALVEM
jgi:hypothetical protein